MNSQDPVERQLEAYNARDVDAFVACYAVDVVVVDAAGVELLRGRAGMREEYAPWFAANAELHAEVVKRMRVDRYVIDEERVTGTPSGELRAVAIYRLTDDGLIDRIQFLP